MYRFLTIIILLSGFNCFGQQGDYRGIHPEESFLHSLLGLTSPEEHDSLNNFKGRYPDFKKTNYELTRTVFGYFPYWAGSNYLNYHWDLLSDLCFFSYEVDPNTGAPITTNGWSTSPAIDSALNNNVTVHLCVTLFSSHGTFFSNPSAQQNLINTIVNLLQSRGGKGVNIDFEAMSPVYKNDFTNFIINLSGTLHNAIPGSKVSIAAPAVNWSETFDIPQLDDYLDFFMIMCYDYYWNGSSQAGPVSGLYSMTGSFDYNLSRTISYYESKGVAPDKIVAGIPYYGRQWPTQSPEAPSAVTGSGTAYTYRYIRNNASGYYSQQNKKWESNSFSPYFSFYTSGWNQCFVEDTFSLGKKYDIVNRRNLAGIGIWALGYDDGYNDLWNLLSSRFTTQSVPAMNDSIFDSGGPAMNYYDKEAYSFSLEVPENNIISLQFHAFSLEAGYDSLWIYDGPDNTSPLLGAFSGIAVPGNILSSGNEITLDFYSDVNTVFSGWNATYSSVPITSIPRIELESQTKFNIFPNPSNGSLYLQTEIENASGLRVQLLSLYGRYIQQMSLTPLAGEHTYQLLPPGEVFPDGGIYLLRITENNLLIHTGKIIMNPSH